MNSGIGVPNRELFAVGVPYKDSRPTSVENRSIHE